MVDDIVVRYDTPEGPITAVDNVSFKVRPGEFLSVIGPSGCGKSTLFNVIGGLLSHHQGVVSVAGETISGPHQSIGMVFQEESTFPWRTVIDNVAFPLELVGMPRAQRAERARHFIALVGLDGFENRYPGELSGGMRQRVSLARTLASEPKILLMDEPFAALDEQTRLLLGDKVLQIQQQLKQTTLLITHNITEAVQMSDRILVMTYRPGKMKRIVDIDLPRPRTSEIVTSEAFGRYVAADLERPARRGEPRHAGRGIARAASRGRCVVTAAKPVRLSSVGNSTAAVVGIGDAGRCSCWRPNPDPDRRHQPLHRAAALGDHRQLLPHDHERTRVEPLPAHRRRMPDRRRHDHRVRHRRRRADAPLQAAAAGLRDLGRRHGLGAAWC